MSDQRKIGEVLEAVVRRPFRHPGTGDEAVLAADRIEGPGAEAWWRIFLDCTPDSPPAKEELWAIVWCKARHDARRAFAERQRALKAAGYEREE